MDDLNSDNLHWIRSSSLFQDLQHSSKGLLKVFLVLSTKIMVIAVLPMTTFMAQVIVQDA